MSDEYLIRALRDLGEQYTPAVVLAEAHLLFGVAVPSTPSRTADGDTSQASGARKASADVTRFSEKSQCGQLLRAIARAGISGLTAQEAASDVTPLGAGMSKLEGCRRRVSDLLRAGYIEDSGNRRANRGSPDLSVVWRVSFAGERALRWMARSGWSKPGRAA